MRLFPETATTSIKIKQDVLGFGNIIRSDTCYLKSTLRSETFLEWCPMCLIVCSTKRIYQNGRSLLLQASKTTTHTYDRGQVHDTAFREPILTLPHVLARIIQPIRLRIWHCKIHEVQRVVHIRHFRWHLMWDLAIIVASCVLTSWQSREVEQVENVKVFQLVWCRCVRSCGVERLECCVGLSGDQKIEIVGASVGKVSQCGMCAQATEDFCKCLPSHIC